MLILYHPFFVMFMIAYWQAIMGRPGYMPKSFMLTYENFERYENCDNPQEVLKDIAKDLPVVTYANNDTVRFCDTCQGIKPDRCHHCSMCQQCVLKMDHHCPWVNNCVGWGNYKYFVLFLFYAILYTMYVALSSLKYFIKFWSGGHHMKVSSNLHVLFLFFVAAMFSISLWSLFGFHIYLLLSNRTTLESFRGPIFQHGPDKNGFNLGRSNNFRQVFGNNKWKWFLPIFTTLGNGYKYPTSFSHGSGGVARNGESKGLLYIDESNERDNLLDYEEPSAVYTGATFVNGGDIKLNGYLDGPGDGERNRSVSDSDDSDEEIAFDLSQHKRNNGQTNVDMTTLLRTRTDNQQS
ncbi:palmitoyltransferase ZDHHC20-B-like [Clytia hemisphaerica]